MSRPSKPYGLSDEHAWYLAAIGHSEAVLGHQVAAGLADGDGSRQLVGAGWPVRVTTEGGRYTYDRFARHVEDAAELLPRPVMPVRTVNIDSRTASRISVRYGSPCWPLPAAMRPWFSTPS